MYTEPQLSLNPFQPTDNANTIEQGVGGGGGGIVCILHWFNAHIHRPQHVIYVGDNFYAVKAVSTLSGLIG